MAHYRLIFVYFVRYFFKIAWEVNHVLIILLAAVILGAIIISRVEGISIGNSIYFSFITGFTIGYGDITPNTVIGRVICVLIGLIGIIFTGLVVAICVRALAKAYDHERKK